MLAPGIEKPLLCLVDPLFRQAEDTQWMLLEFFPV